MNDVMAGQLTPDTGVETSASGDRDEVRDEQIRLLFARAGISLVTTLANSILTVAVLRDVTDHRFALGWIGLVSVVLAGRLALRARHLGALANGVPLGA
jgi:hypothetical protein